MGHSIKYRTERMSAIYARILEWLPETLLTASGAIGIILSAQTSESITVPWLDLSLERYHIAILAIFLIVAGNYAASRKKSRIEAHEAALDELLDFRSLAASGVEEVFERTLRTIGFFSSNSSSQKDPKSRATLYFHDYTDGHTSHFVPIVRLSLDPTLKRFGRLVYPDNQGMIAEVWKSPDAAYKPDLPKEEGEWVSAMYERYGIPRKTAQKMSMKPRSIGGVRIEDSNGKPYAIAIFEYEAARRKFDEIKAFKEEISKGTLSQNARIPIPAISRFVATPGRWAEKLPQIGEDYQ